MAEDHELEDFIRDSKQILDSQADVSLILAKHLLLNYSENSNLVFSPISMQIVLSLLAAGSRDQTLDQLLSFLKAKTTDDLNHLYSYLVDLVLIDGSVTGGPCVSLANGVWIDESLTLKPTFKHVLDTLNKAASHRIDFQKPEEARDLVNSWVEKKTNGLVKEILPPDAVSRDSRLVLANALYFKAEWSNLFDADNTKDYDLYFLNGDSVKVPFMRMWDKQYISVFDDFKVLKLRYDRGCINRDRDEILPDWNKWDKKRLFSMYIFLPDAKDGLPALIEKAGSEPGFLERYIPSKAVAVGEFQIPKFTFEYKIELSEALQTLGLVLPFDRDVGLREMVDGPRPLFVSKIYHKSFIEVNEGGTVAAAATVADVEMGFCLGEEEIEEVLIDFVADHPFLFFIREDKTGIVQFIGQVLDPSTT